MSVDSYDLHYHASSAPYVIWGTLFQPSEPGAGKDYASLFATRNMGAPFQINNLYGLSQGTVPLISDHNWSSPGNFFFTITSNCAWYVTLLNTIGTNFDIIPGSTFGNITLEGTTGGMATATFGGNGQVGVYRNTNTNPGATAVMHIYFSQEGGQSSHSWLCTSSY